jgi:uncharacterized protein (TIGR03435 family)
MKRSIVLSIALAILSFAQPTTTPADLTPAPARKAAPDFSLEDSTRSLIKLSSYKGRVVLLDFWATWCTGCKQEIPWYMEFQDKYKKSGLSAIGVSLDDDGWKSVKPFLQEHKINYPIVVGNWDTMGKSFGFDSMPATLLIDREGKIADLHVGMVDKAAFEREIQILLNEPKQIRASYRQLPGATPSYEYQVASIKPDKSARGMTNLMFTPNGLEATNVTLDMLIREAYGIEDNQISGGPSWLKSDHYDLDAKTDNATAATLGRLSGEGARLAREHMLQALLVDRFKLAVHPDARELPIYALVVANSGLKLREEKPGADSHANGTKGPDGFASHAPIRTGRGQLTGRALPLSALVRLLTEQLGRTVVDKTGLMGNYNFTLQWTPRESQAATFGVGVRATRQRRPSFNGLS